MSGSRPSTAPPAAEVPTARPRPPFPAVLPRLVAWATPPVHLTGVTVTLVLDRRLGGPAEAPEAAVVFGGSGLFALLGALLVAKRPGNPIGWIMVTAALLVGIAPAGDAYAAWVVTTRGEPDALAVVGAWVQSWYWFPLLGLVFVYLPLLFPDGRLPSRRWRPIAVLPALGLAAAVVAAMLADTLTGQEVPYRIDNPIGVDGLAPVEELPVFPVSSALLAVGVVGAVAAVVVRFRRSRGAERQQMKWLVFAVAPAALAPLDAVLPDVVGALAFAWLLLALPVAITVAVLRYRLDGIDVVVNRALVYGTLTAVVVGVYVLVVGYLGAAFRSGDGSTGGELTISLVATGLVAVLFAPLRERVQRAVDRLLYGDRAEPYSVLARLGERLEATLAPDAVLPTIVHTVREVLRLPYAAIAAGSGADAPPAAAAGDPVPDVLRLPLLHHGERVGELRLGRRTGEADFSATDRRLLADLARQAGIAVSAVRLTADLQRARERLVTTREEERRRLRRDLHDGLGAQLAGLAVQAGLLRTLVARDPKAAEELAAELRQELRTAIADIRRLVHGLRPPALDELGLTDALLRLTERIGAAPTGPCITVEVPPDLSPLPAAVEVAVYRVVQEALTNVVRHAGARACAVRLALDGTHLSVEVTDDGRGLPPGGATAGVGFSSMRERAEEMGGGCVVTCGEGGGTRVLARLPLPRGG